MKRNAKLYAVVVISLCMCMLLGMAAFAANLVDIEKHWAKEYIEYGVEKGYISGYEDGTFLPDKTVTRAEFSKMINSAIMITSTGDAKAQFKDVVAKDWFFNEVKKAENAGYITGYAEDNTFRPNNPVTRQEAAVILSRLVLPVAERKDVSSFTDGTRVDSWAKDAVSMIAAKGYIKGDENGNFLPKNALTRSQAAKLICEFVKNENVVNGDKTVGYSNTEVVFSETLFTDDVVFDVEGDEELEVTFKNCRVLGNIIIKNGKVELDLENSSAKVLDVNAGGSSVVLDKNSSIKSANVTYPVELSGNGFAKVVLSGDDLSSVELDGTFADVTVEANANVSADVVKKMNVTKKVALVLLSGTVENLTAESGSKGATITLSSKNVVVKNANNKAVVSYVGSGTIEKATNDVLGVSFDGVVVKEETGKKGEGDSVGSLTDDNFFKNVEVTPKNAETDVLVSQRITLTFLASVYDNKGEKLTAKYVTDNFKLKKGAASSSDEVSFEVTGVTDKKITIKPAANYKNSTKYTLVIPEGVLTYEDGTKNNKFETYFKTIALKDDDDDDSGSGSSSGSDDDSPSVTMSPKDGAEDVSLSTSIKLTFDGSLKAYSGTLDEEYIEDEAIEIREGSKSGDTVNFSASISGKTITLSPSRLLGGKDYYVIILGNKLKVDGSTLSKTTMSFTTEEGTPISISPENGATGVSTLPEIVVSFTEPMLKINGDKLTEEYIQDNVLAIKKGSTKDSADDVYYSVSSIAENGRSFTLIPDEELESATTYYIILEEGSLLGETSEEENAKVTSSFKTASAMAPMFYPTNGKENVSLGTELKISFSDELLVYATNKADRVPVDDEYLDTLINGYEDSKGKIQGKNRITLKRVGASKPLTITATLDSDGKTIIITTDEALLEEKSYTLSIEKNLFYSLNGSTYKANTSGSSTFSTNVAMSPTITPKDDAENVAVTVNPTIVFSEDIFNADGKELKSLYVKNNAITFVDQYGEDVEFTVSVDGSTITVEPEEDLEGNVEYTLTLLAGTITNEDGLANAEKSVTFTTKISYTLEVTPASSKTNVSPFVNPVVKFGTEVVTVDGDPVDEAYASKYIFLTEGSKSTDSDDAVDATIEIGADGRTFTIIPDDQLVCGKKYFINVIEKKFIYAD